jgi:hypothetical protein
MDCIANTLNTAFFRFYGFATLHCHIDNFVGQCAVHDHTLIFNGTDTEAIDSQSIDGHRTIDSTAAQTCRRVFGDCDYASMPDRQ